ncbi:MULTISPECIES: hypothetical protein [Cyanophyceae]|uniref:hypothetical protein n=1 Tax=Cyanophyceae TaxID=3028117 RepID=UPI001688773B|nr:MULTISPECIES: hypothetical protein [Cyanophyceae]MBD1918893.1 hypothetical protein [Phormidium sp. FACHB-77]MBD2033265.1 hypothetical protein [Phormidium sp. FACHB-322]MBD2053802.1 hypothetical protein [Leptolyngbya sp. FACHB-60]
MSQSSSEALHSAAAWLSRQAYKAPYWATQALIRYGLPTTDEYVEKVRAQITDYP